ncbi:hypothetical protein [Pseudorhodoferax sp.]|uniref:hypothetical protein n=1 Tax=Pseudorhodoferax sp. TaxID=1993553 RepID=UPI0039E4F03F
MSNDITYTRPPCSSPSAHLDHGLVRFVTPLELRIAGLLAKVGGLSSAIRNFDETLSGVRQVARIKLVLAESEGRDYFQEVRDRRVNAIQTRLEIANELRDLGSPPLRYAEYRSAANEVQVER